MEKENKRVLVFAYGKVLAHTIRPLVIAQELKKNGYEITFAGDGCYMKLAEQEGFNLLYHSHFNLKHALNVSRSGRVNWYTDQILEYHIKADLDAIHATSPDIVLDDFRLSSGIACKISGVPRGAILNAMWTNFYTPQLRAPEHIAATHVLGKRATTLLGPYIKNLILWYDSLPFKRISQKYGLPPKRNLFEYWAGDLNLIADIPLFAPTSSNRPNNFVYTGPLVWRPNIPVDPQIENKDPDKTTIYITMGSTGKFEYLDKMKEILGNKPKYRCIITTGESAVKEDWPQNFIPLKYAPGIDVMKRSDLVICQGGNGTIQQAIIAGIPIIGIPTMHDQEFNMQRVEDMGIGVQLSDLSFKPSHLITAINHITSHQDFYIQNLERFRRELEIFTGPSYAVREINTFLAHH